MGRSILAVVVGVLVAFVLIMVFEMAGHQLYPPPADMNLSDRASLAKIIEEAPVPALLLVIAAWAVGTCVGTWLTARLARRAAFGHAAIVAGLVLAASIANMLMIPHPAWFWATALVAIAVAFGLGLKLSSDGASPGT